MEQPIFSVQPITTANNPLLRIIGTKYNLDDQTPEGKAMILDMCLHGLDPADDEANFRFYISKCEALITELQNAGDATSLQEIERIKATRDRVQGQLADFLQGK